MSSFIYRAVNVSRLPLRQLIQNSTRGLADNKAGAVWSLGKLNHVAIAVPNLEKAIDFYSKTLGLGSKVSKPQPQPEHGVYTVFVTLGDTKIELLHPLGPKSPIDNFLKKNTEGGIHHMCIEVSDLEAAMATLRSKGIRLLGEKSKIGAHGKPVIFVHPKDCGGVLVELEQQ